MKKLLSICLILLLITNNCWGYTKIGLGGGLGKPNSLKGLRLSLSRDLYQWQYLELDIEASIAKWFNNRNDINNLEVFSLGPMFRVPFFRNANVNTFFQLSVAGAKKSSRTVGNWQSGSKWTFQDILGLGFTYRNKFSASVSYLHYSNGSLADPNPGIDILPLITFTLLF